MTKSISDFHQVLSKSLLDSSDYMGTSTDTWQREAARPIRNVRLRVMEWAPGRFVTDISTLEECHEARAALTDAILSIEGQLEAHEHELRHGKLDKNVDWVRRANSALSTKKRHLDEVIARSLWLKSERVRADQQSRERRLLDFIEERLPTSFASLVAEAKAEGVIA